VFFTIICYNTIGLSSEYSPVTRWVVDSNLFLIITNAVVQLVLVTFTKSEFISDADEVKDDQITEDTSETDKVPIQSNTMYKFLMSTGNVYCASSFCITFYYILFFLQAVPFGSQLDNSPRMMTHSNKDEYHSSDRIAWKNSVLGHAWELKSSNPDVYAGDSEGFYITGSIAFGVVVAYSLIVWLLAVYCAYSGTPVGEYVPLFLDVRSLTITNGFVAFAMKPVVDNLFIECGQITSHLDVFFFLFVVCFDDYIATIFLRLLPKIRQLLARDIYWAIWWTVVSMFPPFWGLVVYGIPEVILLGSLVLSLLSICIVWVQYARMMKDIAPPSIKMASLNVDKTFTPVSLNMNIFNSKELRFRV
jgi:hypothetical protein